MRNFLLSEPVELTLPAQQSMMLVLRLTTAGVVARASLTVDRLDDIKLAVEEACSCLIDAGGTRRLHLRFSEEDDALHISIRGEGGAPAAMGEDECTVARCILESLVDGVELRMEEGVIAGIELRVALRALD